MEQMRAFFCLSCLREMPCVPFTKVVRSMKMTTRFAFVEYKTDEEATKAIKEINGYRLDKKHTVLCNSFRDIMLNADAPKTLELPNAPTFNDFGDPRQWLQVRLFT